MIPVATEVATEVAVQVNQTRDDTLLGASEAAAVLGLDRYRSPMSVWMAKRAARAGDSPPADEKPAFVHEAAEWGGFLEPIIRGHYALSTQSYVGIPVKSIAASGYLFDSGSLTNGPAGERWLRCTPDGFVGKTLDGGRDPGTTGEWSHAEVPGWADGLLEVKTCSAYKADEWADGVPAGYECQVRVQMAICGLAWCDVICLAGGQRILGPFRILRDATLEMHILRDLRAFWQLVLDGVPPSVDDSEAWSQRAASLMKPGKVVLHADDELRALMVEMRQTRAQRKQAEAMEQAQRTQILLRLGAAGATVVDGGDLGKCTAYPNPARMDYKAYSEALERVISSNRSVPMPTREDFKKPGSGWSVRAPRSWGDDE